MADLKELEALLKKAAREMPDKTGRIVEVEGLRFIKENFRRQGWQAASFQRWKRRKTLDRKGRNITRYRTNRVGTKGSPNRYGRKITGRAILRGHNTGGDKLANSFRSRRSRKQIRFYTYKGYAAVHNEGLDHMPQRQFMGPSPILDRAIKKKVKREHDRLFKQ